MSLVEKELLYRLDILARAQTLESWPLLSPREVRDLGIYGGASGVWVDKTRTQEFAKEGVAVGLLHTGRHYDDDIDESGVLYHYPTTQRPESRDSNEIKSIKNAKSLKLPIFVIRNVGARKKIDLAWLDDFDDQLRICVLTFHGVNPESNTYRSSTELATLPLFGPRKKSTVEVLRADRDPLFKFNILKRFQGACLVTEINVTEMLDAAHKIDVIRPIEATPPATFQGLDLRKTLFPEAQHMLRQIEFAGHFADRSVGVWSFIQNRALPLKTRSEPNGINPSREPPRHSRGLS